MESANGDIKDKLLASLLQPMNSNPPKRKGPLIQDLSAPSHATDEDVLELVDGVETDVSVPVKSKTKSLIQEVLPHPPTPPEDEGPTMMEQIMAAQEEALRSQKIAKEVEERKAAKEFGKGGSFKKGFFSSNDNDNDNKNKDKKKKKEEEITTLRSNKQSIAQSKAESLKKVNEDIQKSLSEEENEMVKELKKGDWMTPSLVTQFQSNPIVAAGLQDPECTDAMQLMQTKPKEGQKKYANNAKVDTFLREFGKIMSGHFDNLSKEKEKEANDVGMKAQTPASVPAATIAKPKIIEEVTKTTKSLKKKKDKGFSFSFGDSGSSKKKNQIVKSSASSTTTSSGGTGGMGPLAELSLKTAATRKPVSEEEDKAQEKKAKELMDDPKLVQLMMDPETQQLMMDVGDPVKFSKIMQDPFKRVKIKKLMDAGLLATG
jgi:hypothetical protein